MSLQGKRYLPTTFTGVLSSAGTGPWFPVGPCLGNKITIVAAYTGTTGAVKVQGCLDTDSTIAAITLASRTYAQRTASIASTYAGTVAYLRLASTSLQAAKTVRVVGAIVL